MKTVHLIGNAHLDPVWLWQRSDGTDSALATARSACDRLDEYPEFVFTCSGRWFHEQVERLDPALFERIVAHVRSGRWQPVGGMVIQPDCNLPSAESMARQLAAGQAYYRRAFGAPTTIGYNVDSFGHNAYLPRWLREANMDSYVFMRPGPHEKALPASLFRWRSPDGAEVTAFRIAGGYTFWGKDLREHIEAALAAMPEGIEHTMCFFGVGDHGGGPTKVQIEWLLAHRSNFPGARLVFSPPRAYFDAVAHARNRLPVVEGELQHHAIGCYAVERRIKVAMRRAESRLVQAEETLKALPRAAAPDAAADLERAWNAVLFNQFHDIYGGTCLPEASDAVTGELVAAAAEADRLITETTRRALRTEARPGQHRIVLFNPSPQAFDGYVVHELFRPPAPCALVDERGVIVPSQTIEARAKSDGFHRLLFKVSIPPPVVAGLARDTGGGGHGARGDGQGARRGGRPGARLITRRHPAGGLDDRARSVRRSDRHLVALGRQPVRGAGARPFRVAGRVDVGRVRPDPDGDAEPRCVRTLRSLVPRHDDRRRADAAPPPIGGVGRIAAAPPPATGRSGETRLAPGPRERRAARAPARRGRVPLGRIPGGAVPGRRHGRARPAVAHHGGGHSRGLLRQRRPGGRQPDAPPKPLRGMARPLSGGRAAGLSRDRSGPARI